MNVDDITWRLAQLASLPYQERYVIGGTSEGHIVAIELLEDVDALKYLLRRPEHRSIVTDEQMYALEELFAAIESNWRRALSARSREEGARLIRESGVWKDLREKAKAALCLFGLLIDQMSVEDIDRLCSE
jgi:hypothetical protein